MERDRLPLHFVNTHDPLCHKAHSHGNILILHLGVDPWNKRMWLDFDGLCWYNFGNRWLKEVLIYV